MTNPLVSRASSREPTRSGTGCTEFSKGFKPGTNAQRHRFYRHGSSDVSSRFAGLTSMVRESFRASFRRANVVSESSADSEKESPVQPAARPQLSWRASAPEYGTFE